MFNENTYTRMHIINRYINLSTNYLHEYILYSWPENLLPFLKYSKNHQNINQPIYLSTYLPTNLPVSFIKQNMSTLSQLSGFIYPEVRRPGVLQLPYMNDSFWLGHTTSLLLLLIKQWLNLRTSHAYFYNPESNNMAL